MIRDLVQLDRQNWEKLYIGYAEFYKVPMNNEILNTVWSWLFDKKHVVNGLCYETEGKIVGIAHYRTIPRPLRGKYIGFLDDLFGAQILEEKNWSKTDNSFKRHS